MDNSKELLARVNPVYTTGKGAAGCLAQAGNKDAAAIVSKMDLSDIVTGDTRVPEIITKCYATALEARYEISNALIKKENKPNLIDLPSGYTPRAFAVAREGNHYVGFDLPVVASDIGPIVEGILTDDLKDKVEYYGVDATNYDSMRNNLNNISGEVCIATDGLLGYFNEPELISMCDNVKRLLKEFGGCWLTADATSEAIFGATFGVLLKGNPEILRMLSMNTASQMADVQMKQNSLYKEGPDKAAKFLESQGFNVEKVSFADLMPSLVSVPDKNVENELREAYRKIEVWKMTLADKGVELKEHVKSGDFGADFNINGSALKIALSGRLDTITAPDLLAKYEEVVKDKTISSVEIDVKDTQYISSAGLRVLLIIYKAVENKDNFRMTNIGPVVKEILDITGFDQYFL